LPQKRSAIGKPQPTLQQGHAFHSLPTAFIFVVGDERVPLSEASA